MAFFEVMLDCDCIVMVENAIGKNGAICPNHMGMHAILAIETREWHVKCHSCRFGKWAGQSQNLAKRYEWAHLQKRPQHKVSIDYISTDKVRDEWRKVYGRKRYPRRFIAVNFYQEKAKVNPYAIVGERENSNGDQDPPPF